MAVFGPQFIVTLVALVFWAKLGKFYSAGRRVLCHKLFRYLSPSSDDLKKAVRKHYQQSLSSNSKEKKKQNKKLFDIDESKDEFNIPEDATIELSMTPVMPHDLYYIKYADEFQSFVDVSIVALAIYVIIEMYIAIFQFNNNSFNEINLSVLWCGVCVAYGIRMLTTLAWNYMKSSTNEGALVFIFGGLSFIVSLLVQLADVKFLDFNLKEAYRNMSSTSLDLISPSSKPSSAFTTNTAGQAKQSTPQRLLSHLQTYSSNELLFTFGLAGCSALVGALFFFPAFRLARLHLLGLKYSSESKARQFFFQLNFIAPLLVSLCWLLPAAFKSPEKHNSSPLQCYGASNSAQMQFIQIISEKKLKEANFLTSILMADNLKLYLVLGLFVLRMSMYRHYAQSYLNLAFELAHAMRASSSRITNTKYMRTVSSIYQYYGVVAIQYCMPVYIMLFLSLVLKTTGEHSWCSSPICSDLVSNVKNTTSIALGFGGINGNDNGINLGNSKPMYTPSPTIMRHLEEQTRLNLTTSHNAVKQVFTPMVMRSLVGYFTFWTATIYFIISCFGLLYYQYIDKAVYF